jgi:predicted RNase H-like HicB family nuclease
MSQYLVIDLDNINRWTRELVLMRQVIIYPGEDGYWVAEVPSLPGCISQGKTKEEAIANIRVAIEAYINALKEDCIPVPEDHLEAILAVV